MNTKRPRRRRERGVVPPPPPRARGALGRAFAGVRRLAALARRGAHLSAPTRPGCARERHLGGQRAGTQPGCFPHRRAPFTYSCSRPTQAVTTITRSARLYTCACACPAEMVARPQVFDLFCAPAHGLCRCLSTQDNCAKKTWLACSTSRSTRIRARGSYSTSGCQKSEC